MILDDYTFTKVQKASVTLIQNDLRFLYTVFANRDKLKNNYILSLLPYLGIIIDGAEDWVNRYNKSTKIILPFPTFTEIEQRFYGKMRNATKLWDLDYCEAYGCMKKIYENSEMYFSRRCGSFARILKLYDIFGADIASGEYCGNTVLYSYYYPDYSYDEMPSSEDVQSLFVIGGRYTKLFNADNVYPTRDDMHFSSKNFGGLIKSPVGNRFSNRFVLFSILCQVNYLLVCIEHWVSVDISTKVRFAYLLYYYLVRRVPEINIEAGTNFQIRDDYASDRFRNAMAHYGLGVVLKPEDIVEGDPLYGLSSKILRIEYPVLKTFLLENLSELALQIKQYLRLKNPWSHRIIEKT